MWFIGVEVEQETSAPPPKKNPGSTPVTLVQIIFNRSYSIGFVDGTVIVRSDGYSWCAAGFRIGSIAICYVYQ